MARCSSYGRADHPLAAAADLAGADAPGQAGYLAGVPATGDRRGGTGAAPGSAHRGQQPHRGLRPGGSGGRVPGAWRRAPDDGHRWPVPHADHRLAPAPVWAHPGGPPVADRWACAPGGHAGAPGRFVVAAYPEGRISLDPGVWPERGKTGVARLALTTGTPVVPVSQWGAHEVLAWDGTGAMARTALRSVLRRPVVRVHFGAPVDLADLGAGVHGDAQLATERIMGAITEGLRPLRASEPRLPRFVDPTRPVSVARSRTSEPTKTGSALAKTGSAPAAMVSPLASRSSRARCSGASCGRPGPSRAASSSSASGSVTTGPMRARSASRARPVSLAGSVMATTPAPRAAASRASSAVSRSLTRPKSTRREAETSHAGSVRAKPSRVCQPARASRRNTAVASVPEVTMYRGRAGSPERALTVPPGSLAPRRPRVPATSPARGLRRATRTGRSLGATPWAPRGASPQSGRHRRRCAHSPEDLQGQGSRLGTRTRAQLAHAGADVGLHGLPGDAQLASDAPGWFTMCDQAQHVAFPVAEVVAGSLAADVPAHRVPA